ncbi:MAG: polyketide synthase [Polyangiaceae bacterium]|jgi:predicted DsbA family dithiol-disulfide isomerase|nr:polyketide synthase [Polyangiaceae bacterium]
MAPLSITVDVFSDVVCPWCYIGSARLTQALQGLAGEVQAEVCYHPFFLDPTMTNDGVSIADKLRKKYGVEPKQLWGKVEAAARDSGLELDLSRQQMMYPTVAAHTLLRHAHDRDTQPALAHALFKSYFMDAQNIADVDVLARVAQPYGFSRSEALELASCEAELELTREEAQASAACGIRGVPFFIFAGNLAVSGAQPVSVLQGAIRQALLHPVDSEPPPPPV